MQVETMNDPTPFTTNNHEQISNDYEWITRQRGHGSQAELLTARPGLA